MLASRPSLFHVERPPRGVGHTESPGWCLAWKAPWRLPGTSPQARPPADILWALRLARMAPVAGARARLQRGSSGAWAALRIDSLGPGGLPPVCCAGWRVFDRAGPPLPVLPVAGVVSRGFRLCRRLVVPAPGEDPAAAPGEVWADVPGAFSRVVQRGVFAGVRNLGLAHLRDREPGGLVLCRGASGFAGDRRWRVSLGEVFYVEHFRGRACGWREREGFSLVFPGDFLASAMGAGEIPGRGSWRLGLYPAMAGWLLILSPGELLVAFVMFACPMRRGSLRVVLRGTSGAFVGWLVACEGRLAGPDGPGAFLFSS